VSRSRLFRVLLFLVVIGILFAAPLAWARTTFSSGGSGGRTDTPPTATVETVTTTTATPTSSDGDPAAPTSAGGNGGGAGGGTPPGGGVTPLCVTGIITNTTPPSISPTSGDVPKLVSTTNGGWASCNDAITGYQYQWKRNGNVVASGSSSYTATSSDVGSTIQSSVAACNSFGCSSFVDSSNSGNYTNSGPPPNHAPVTPYEDVYPPDQNWTIDGRSSTPFYMKYSDPDGDSGHITYTIRNSSGAVVETVPGITVVSGADSIGYTNTSTPGAVTWTAVAADNKGASSGTSDTHNVTMNRAPDKPVLVSPQNNAVLPTSTPVLTASAFDAEGDPLRTGSR